MDDKPAKVQLQLQRWVPPEGSALKVEVLMNGYEIRRVEAKQLFSGNQPTVHVYKRLSRKIFMLYGMKPTKEGVDLVKEVMSGKVLRTTYIDEEGDEITFSSDDELVQACKQAFGPGKQKKILRVKTYVVEERSIRDVLSPSPEQLEKTTTAKKTDAKRFGGENSNGGKKFKYLKERIEALEQKMDSKKKQFRENSLKDCKDKSDKIVHLLSFLEAIMALLAKFTLSLKDQVAICKKNDKSTELNTSVRTDMLDSSTVKSNMMENAIPLEEINLKEGDDLIEREGKNSNSNEQSDNEKVEEDVGCNDALKIDFKEILSSLSHLHLKYQCDGCLMNPIVGTRYRATNRLNYDVCERCFNAKNFKPLSLEFESIPNDPKPPGKFEIEDKLSTPSEFIHGRHTCDGCMMNPIIGLRYHALNLPDYDLCGSCYDKVSKKEENDIVFEAAELDRDRLRQPMWKRKLEKGGLLRDRKNMKANSDVVIGVKKENDSASKEDQSAPPLNVADVVDENMDSVLRVSENHVATDKVEKASVATEEKISHELTVEGVETVTENLKKLDASAVFEFRNEVDISGVEDVESEKAELVSLVEASSVKSGFDLLQLDGSSDIDDESKVTKTSESFVMGPDVKVKNEEVDRADVSLIEQVNVTEVDGACAKSDNVESQMKSDDDITLGVATEDEWDMMVTEEKYQIKHDEMLARAAQMIGSALFEEDVKKPKEELSTKSESSKISSLGTSELFHKSLESTTTLEKPEGVASRSLVGSSSKEVSHTNDVAKNYWQKELDQLRDLGFGDEDCVEALECLKAANIGVNSNEEIKLERVVDFLLMKLK